MKVAEFDFALPPERIATRPAVPRECARLLHLPAVGGIADTTIGDLPDRLRPGDLLILNDTKVLPVRLSGRIGDRRVEGNLLTALDDCRWTALVRPARRFRVGDTVDWGDGFSAQVEARGEGGMVTLRFDRSGADLMVALDRFGAMPLPPYIARLRPPDAADRRDYQSVFAACPGAVAAPTASLHLTHDLLDRLTAAGVARATVTLHVGAGTFLPVKVDDTDHHRMHAEWGEVSADTAATINQARAEGRRIVAVGTTALRLVESAAAPDGTVTPFRAWTDIFITPGYRFRVVDLLLTNFHLPRSTLVMLVAAFAGHERIKAAYDHAIAAGYRFYSYGDACLLERAHVSS